MTKFLQIILNDWIFVHVGIHRRSNDLFTFACHDSCCQHVIRNAAYNLSNNIRRRRSDQHHIRLFCQRDMLYTILKIAVKCINQTFGTCQCLKCDRINKIGRILRHQYVYLRMHLHKHTCQICDLICCNTPCHTEYHRFSLKHLSFLHAISVYHIVSN